MAELVEGCGVVCVGACEVFGFGEMDGVGSGRVIGLVAAVVEDFDAHIFGEFGHKLVDGNLRVVDLGQGRDALDVAGVKDGRIAGGELEFGLLAAAGQFVGVLVPGEGFLLLKVVGVPVFHVGGFGAFL